ncbi:MAG TPA: DJ-1/PfpI family protein [Candidatus Acidoferrales bacterium]|nr:DJ-1/PfpI family protein [Candidatus Acidoferrales bacterium]
MWITGKGLWIAVLIVGILQLMIFASHGKVSDAGSDSRQEAGSLKPPASGKINVAFLISEGADVMDIAGPWEVFSDAMLTTKGKPWHESDGDDMVMVFNVYTVSDSVKPVDANRLTIAPNYDFDHAPKPQIIVIPAQAGRTAAQKAWLLANSAAADVTMSVCTGAAMLAEYGLLDGKTATTHHAFQQSMQKQYPAVHFVSGTRFVDHGKIATAGGLTSGIDLALHIVARYYGNETAQVTADILEHHSALWKNPEYEQVKPVVASK